MISPAKLFRNAQLILLDFDGPVTRLLPPPSNRVLAERVRRYTQDRGIHLTNTEMTTSDHLALIRAAAATPHAREVEAYASQAEVEAARTSPVTSGLDDLLKAAHTNECTVVIVTNNSPAAAAEFLAVHQLTDFVTEVFGRDPDHIERMKPNSFILDKAKRLYPRKNTVMIGDSVSDAEAAAAAEVPAIGIAKNATRQLELEAAGCAAVVHTLFELLS